MPYLGEKTKKERNIMNVWLYARLSRDEDSDMNSLNNQRRILLEYAERNGHTVVGESSDDNISGMHFNRPRASMPSMPR